MPLVVLSHLYCSIRVLCSSPCTPPPSLIVLCPYQHPLANAPSPQHIQLWYLAIVFYFLSGHNTMPSHVRPQPIKTVTAPNAALGKPTYDADRGLLLIPRKSYPRGNEDIWALRLGITDEHYFSMLSGPDPSVSRDAAKEPFLKHVTEIVDNCMASLPPTKGFSTSKVLRCVLQFGFRASSQSYSPNHQPQRLGAWFLLKCGDLN